MFAATSIFTRVSYQLTYRIVEKMKLHMICEDPVTQYVCDILKAMHGAEHVKIKDRERYSPIERKKDGVTKQKALHHLA